MFLSLSLIYLNLLLVSLNVLTLSNINFYLPVLCPGIFTRRVFAVNLLASFTAKILQCGKSFLFEQIRWDVFLVFSTRVCVPILPANIPVHGTGRLPSFMPARYAKIILLLLGCDARVCQVEPDESRGLTISENNGF